MYGGKPAVLVRIRAGRQRVVLKILLEKSGVM
jgi:hypothetical protein